MTTTCADCVVTFRISQGETLRLCPLHAAASAMFTALQGLVVELEGDLMFPDDPRRSRLYAAIAAIAKARGES